MVALDPGSNLSKRNSKKEADPHGKDRQELVSTLIIQEDRYARGDGVDRTRKSRRSGRAI